ncbi:MAG TPA: glucose-6-phosphate isomerase [Phycisphaerales bacterium]|nr:glucose-6-phosphate isomerase [Phycisphaerales bacterium]
MLTLHFANTLSDRVGPHGLDPLSLGADSPSARMVKEWTASLEATRNTGWERWRGLPFDPMRKEHVNAVKGAVARCKGQFDSMVVLGIGGSALGNIALQSALNPSTYNLLPASQRPGPRVFVVDNVDPASFGAVLKFCEQSDPGLKRTLFNVISKSGETAETAAQFMTIRALLIERLGKASHAQNIVAVTDPAKGTMRQICNDNGYLTMPVPDGVGGRFSVLSPVGLFSAAMAGIDIDALLDGAADMDRRCSVPDLRKNPAAMLAVLLTRLGREKGKGVHVMMPYSNNLYLLADWFRQLWAESLGKRVDKAGKEVFAGFTPVKALGTTDQHSQVQLYREGPNDKVFGFIEVKDFGRDELAIPTGLGVEAIRYLEGQKFGTLLNAEKRATEYALVESRRPSFTIEMPRIDARHVGEFICLWEMVTAYCGLILNIDAYDQPAVETGKVATFGLMGRQGYEEWKQKVNSTLAPSEHKI